MSDRASSRRTGAHRQRGELKRFGDRWRIRLRGEPDANGKRPQRWQDVGPIDVLPCEEDARRAAESLLDRLAPPRFRIGTVMTWPAACDLYRQRDLAELAEGTKRTYGQLIRDYIEPAFCSQHVHEITQALVQDWIWSHIAAAKKNPLPRIERLAGLLLTMLGRLRLHGLAVAPIDRKLLRFPRERRIPKSLKNRSFAVAEMDQLLAAAHCARDRALLGLLRFLGLRISEAAGLTTNALHLDGEQPFLDVCAAAPRGKLQQTKTARATRTLPIPPPLVQLLRAWLAELPTTPEGFLFPGRAPGRAWHPDAIRRRVLRPLIKQLGLPPLSFHALRHGCAYALVGAGNLADAARVLGHKDAQLTSHYAEATVAGMRAAVVAAAAPPAEVGKFTAKS